MLFPLNKGNLVKHNYRRVTALTWCHVNAKKALSRYSVHEIQSAVFVFCRSLWHCSERAEINAETTWKCGSCGGGSKTHTGSREKWCQGGTSYH